MKDLGAPLVHSSERSGDDSRFVTEVYSGRLATWDKGDSAPYLPPFEVDRGCTGRS
jgi:hypothetical protein